MHNIFMYSTYNDVYYAGGYTGIYKGIQQQLGIHFESIASFHHPTHCVLNILPYQLNI